jgi:hypothetical protein
VEGLGSGQASSYFILDREGRSWAGSRLTRRRVAFLVSEPGRCVCCVPLFPLHMFISTLALDLVG